MPDLIGASDPDTDADGDHAITKAFPQPSEGSPPLLWWKARAGLSYAPYLVKVTAFHDDEALERASISFLLLDKEKGTPTHNNPITEKLYDYRKLYAFLPSTAQFADPGDPTRNCGFLFLAQAYTLALIASEHLTAGQVAAAHTDDKWPRGAGALHRDDA